MHIACIGVVGKHGEPLLLRVFKDGLAIDALDTVVDSEKDSVLLRYHYIVHSSLDLVDERHKQPGAAPGGSVVAGPKVSMYLGYLCPIEEFHVYGYVTNTHVKIIVGVEEQQGIGTSQPELQTLCKQTHHLYANQQINPFTPLPSPTESAPVTSRRFTDELDKMVKGFNTRNSAN